MSIINHIFILEVIFVIEEVSIIYTYCDHPPMQLNERCDVQLEAILPN